MGERRFENQVVWITGASSGIGEALAKGFAREGARLVLSARRESELRRVAAACVGSASVDVVPFDLSDIEALPIVVDEVVRRIGRIDLMVHNAGISQRSFARDTALSVDRRLMEVNYFAVVAMTKALLPHMLSIRGGRFVVVSSVMGLFGAKLRSAYSASKHALHGFFESLEAEHHADGLRVTMVCPGFVATDIAVNALRGDGSTYAVRDAENAAGLSPDAAASRILDGVARGRSSITPGGKEIAGVYLKRFAPAVLARVLRSRDAG